jgi:hypothetical protein
MVPAEADEAAASVEVINGSSDESGRFTIEGVPPGSTFCAQSDRHAAGCPVSSPLSARADRW